MALIVQDITLEVAKPNYFPALTAKQGDVKSRFLKITLANNGEKIEIKPTSTARISGTRPDGQSKTFGGEVNNDGTATVPLAAWMLELPGALTCDVTIVDAETRKLTSTSFEVKVDAAACSDENLAQDDSYDFLSLLANDSRAAIAEEFEKAREQGYLEIGPKLVGKISPHGAALPFCIAAFHIPSTVTTACSIIISGYSSRPNIEACGSWQLEVTATNQGGQYNEACRLISANAGITTENFSFRKNSAGEYALYFTCEGDTEYTIYTSFEGNMEQSWVEFFSDVKADPTAAGTAITVTSNSAATLRIARVRLLIPADSTEIAFSAPGAHAASPAVVTMNTDAGFVIKRAVCSTDAITVYWDEPVLTGKSCYLSVVYGI